MAGDEVTEADSELHTVGVTLSQLGCIIVL